MPKPAPITASDLVRARELWPVREAAYRLGMHVRTLYRKADAGELKFTRVGGRVYVSERELQRYIAAAERAS